MSIHQISVFLENRVGQLADVVRLAIPCGQRLEVVPEGVEWGRVVRLDQCTQRGVRHGYALQLHLYI